MSLGSIVKSQDPASSLSVVILEMVTHHPCVTWRCLPGHPHTSWFHPVLDDTGLSISDAYSCASDQTEGPVQWKPWSAKWVLIVGLSSNGMEGERRSHIVLQHNTEMATLRDAQQCIQTRLIHLLIVIYALRFTAGFFLILISWQRHCIMLCCNINILQWFSILCQLTRGTGQTLWVRWHESGTRRWEMRGCRYDRC